MTGTYVSFYNLGSFTAKDCKHQGKSTHSLLIEEQNKQHSTEADD